MPRHSPEIGASETATSLTIMHCIAAINPLPLTSTAYTTGTLEPKEIKAIYESERKKIATGITDLSKIEFWNVTRIYVGRIPANQK